MKMIQSEHKNCCDAKCSTEVKDAKWWTSVKDNEPEISFSSTKNWNQSNQIKDWRNQIMKKKI